MNDTSTPRPNAHDSNSYKNAAKRDLQIAYEWARFAAWRHGIKPIAKSSGFWTAAATIAIAVTTIAYTHYARRQWQTMERQLTYFEATQSAEIVIDEFKPEISAGKPGQGELIRGNLTIRDVGPTTAKQIHIEQGYWGMSSLPKEGCSIAVPEPLPAGPSLGQGQTHDIPVATQFGDATQQGRFFEGVGLAVGYRDVFGNVKVVSECLVYDPRRQRFLLYPVHLEP